MSKKITHVTREPETFEKELRGLLEAVDGYALCACSEAPCPLIAAVQTAEHALKPQAKDASQAMTAATRLAAITEAASRTLRRKDAADSAQHGGEEER